MTMHLFLANYKNFTNENIIILLKLWSINCGTPKIVVRTDKDGAYNGVIKLYSAQMSLSTHLMFADIFAHLA